MKKKMTPDDDREMICEVTNVQGLEPVSVKGLLLLLATAAATAALVEKGLAVSGRVALARRVLFDELLALLRLRERAAHLVEDDVQLLLLLRNPLAGHRLLQ